MAEWIESRTELAGDPTGLGDMYRMMTAQGPELRAERLADMLGVTVSGDVPAGTYGGIRYENGILSYTLAGDFGSFDDAKAISEFIGEQLRVRCVTRYGNGSKMSEESFERVVQPGCRSLGDFIEPDWEKARTEKPFSRTARHDLADVARDLAIEYTVGGDRFDGNDIADMLRGMRKEDLDLLRSVTRRNAEMIKPDVQPSFLDGMERAYLGGVVCCGEPDGQGGTVPLNSSFAFRMDRLEFDKGKWFRLADGTVEQCVRFTREQMWDDRFNDLQPVQIDKVDAIGVALDRMVEKYGKKMTREDGTVCRYVASNSSAVIWDGFIEGYSDLHGGALHVTGADGEEYTVGVHDVDRFNQDSVLEALYDDRRVLDEGLLSSLREESVQEVLMEFVADGDVRIVDSATAERHLIREGVLFTDVYDCLQVGGRVGGAFVSCRLDRLDDASLKTIMEATTPALGKIVSQMVGQKHVENRRKTTVKEKGVKL